MYFVIFYLHAGQVISNRKMLALKEITGKIPEGFTFSKDMLDDMLMVNGYNLKMITIVKVATTWPLTKNQNFGYLFIYLGGEL